MLTLVNIPLCLVGGIVAVFLASPGTLSSLFGAAYIPPSSPWLPSWGSLPSSASPSAAA